MRIQTHMIEGLLSLGPEVLPVIFTDDPYYLNLCQTFPSIRCISQFSTNKYGLPYIRSFMVSLDSLPGVHCAYQGYVNGDILLHPNLLTVLSLLRSQSTLHSKQLVISRRTNYPWVNITSLPNVRSDYARLLQRICASDAPYMSNAVDLFVYTPGTFDYRTMKGIVVGRTAIDGYLISYARDPLHGEIDVLDVTESGRTAWVP